jgi:lipid-binding SYLF domain-containing protein
MLSEQYRPAWSCKIMNPHHYDIVRKEGETLLWLEDAKDLDSAVSRIRELTSFWPGKSQMMDQQNHRLVAENTDLRQLSVVNPGRNLEKHRGHTQDRWAEGFTGRRALRGYEIWRYQTMSGMNEKLCSLFVIFALALVGIAWTPAALAKANDNEKENDRIRNAGTVLKEVLDVPENIPRSLLDKARCVIVLPSVLKAAFVVGGDYGRGVMTCRTGADRSGAWGSAPVMIALEGGSVGFQIGGQATDFVILIMNNRGADSLLHSKVKLGADASVAAGPKGREAEAATDVTMRAEMLSYSRARGLFAGVSLEGSTLRPDGDANERLYGKDVSAKDIIEHPKIAPPESAHTLLSALRRASPQLKA